MCDGTGDRKCPSVLQAAPVGKAAKRSHTISVLGFVIAHQRGDVHCLDGAMRWGKAPGFKIRCV